MIFSLKYLYFKNKLFFFNINIVLYYILYYIFNGVAINNIFLNNNISIFLKNNIIIKNKNK